MALPISGSPSLVSIHPTVVLAILDHYVRRRDNQKRVIGTLMGFVDANQVFIRSSFPLPHSEEENVSVDLEFHKSMSELLQRASPGEDIVGWYMSGSVDEHCVVIHEFHSQQVEGNPIFMTVDTNVSPDTPLEVATYTSRPIALFKSLGVCFERVPHLIETEDIHTLLHQKDKPGEPTRLLDEFSTLQFSITKLNDMLENARKYINDVCSGKIKGDPKIGRFLLSSLHSLPRIDGATFDTLFKDSMQDILMIVYLSQLTRSQMMVAERLQAGV